MSIKSLHPFPHRDAPNSGREKKPTSHSLWRLISLAVLFGIGFCVVLIGSMLTSVGIMTVGVLTIILAVGIIVLSEQAF
jgi:hypothetical protein